MNPRFTILVVWMILWMLIQQDPEGNTVSIPLKDSMADFELQLQKINNLTYTPLPEDVLSRIPANDFRSDSTFYTNLTAAFTGTFFSVLSNVSIPGFEYSNGNMRIALFANKTETSDVNYLEGAITLTTRGLLQTSELYLRLKGLQFVSTGLLVLGGSVRGSDITYDFIPKIMPSDVTFNTSKSVLQNIITWQIEKLKADLLRDPSAFSEHSIIKHENNCTFNIYGQLSPSHLTPLEIIQLDSELSDPQGLPTKRPKLNLDMYIYSPDCSTHFKSHNLKGTLSGHLTFSRTIYAFFSSAVILTQLVLTTLQMRYTSTQSAQSKVSAVCIAMQIIQDAYLALIHLVTALVVNHSEIWFVVAFFGVILVGVYELPYLPAIMRAQRVDETRVLSVYSRFYAGLVIGMVVGYRVVNSSPLIAAILSFISYSFWVPQIWCNVWRNSRRVFHPWYVVGMSAARLAVPMYLFWLPNKIVAYNEVNANVVLVLVVWVVVQAAVLFLQESIGPRVFVPAEVLPVQFEYHRVVQDEESGLKGDCAVCFLKVDFDDKESRMITPCNHVFHTDCLEKWMEIKLECPVCRNELPPL